MTRTVGASYLHRWSAFQRAAISKHRYGVIGLTWRSRSAASDGRKIVLITLPLKVSRSRLAPNPTALPSRGLPSRCLSFRSWTISTSICTEKKIAPATQIRHWGSDGQGPPKTAHVTRHGPGTTKRLNPRGPRAVWAENFCCFVAACCQTTSRPGF